MYLSLQTPSFRLLKRTTLLPNSSLGGATRWGSLNVLFSLVCVFLFLLSVPALTRADGEFTSNGEIIVLIPDSSVVALEVQLDGRPRIIGGSLAPGAILLKNNRKSDLRQFSVGEHVKVSWRERHGLKEIVTLISHKPSQAASAQSIAAPGDAAEPLPQVNTNSPAESPLHPVPVGAIIGTPQYHIIVRKETLLDIARNFKLGYNEIVDLYPDLDPWLPPVGKKLLLPTEHVLPDSGGKGIVINIPEMRLYYFKGMGKQVMVSTFPIGIGDTDAQTVPGNYAIGSKRVNPTWYIPPSLLAKYKVKSIPPGPDNPLGQYWLGLAGTMFGIHGSDIPWSVGRKVTHGCIRMYPEDISVFFKAVPIGTRVQIVYEPVKIARVGEKVLLEVHSDIYGKIPDLPAYAQKLAMDKGVWEMVEPQRFMQVVRESRGIPVDVSSGFSLTVNTGQ